MRPVAKPRQPRRTDRRYGSKRWLRVSDLVLGRHRRPDRSASPITAACWWPDTAWHLAQVADHIEPVYPGMSDADFYGLHNLRPACQAHNKAAGFIAAQARRSAAQPETPGRASIFTARRRPRVG